jgi:hypothetical protein
MPYAYGRDLGLRPRVIIELDYRAHVGMVTDIGNFYLRLAHRSPGGTNNVRIKPGQARHLHLVIDNRNRGDVIKVARDWEQNIGCATVCHRGYPSLPADAEAGPARRPALG